MRFTLEYALNEEKLPLDYRRGFLSLIKSALQTQGQFIFNKFMRDYKLKPFTYSVYFPKLKGEENDTFLVGDYVKLNVSTSSLEFGTHLYNGLRLIKEFKMFNCGVIHLKNIVLQKSTNIKNSEIVFKTLSPVLVSNKGSSDWYLLPGEENFDEGLRFSVQEIAREFMDCNEEFPFEFEYDKNSIKKKIVWHYNMHRSGFVGTFKIKSTTEILQLIYDVGLGVRRSQGFGMLEVVKQ